MEIFPETLPTVLRPLRISNSVLLPAPLEQKKIKQRKKFDNGC